LDEIPIGSMALQPYRQLLAGGMRVRLGRRALSILSKLAEADGDVLTKEELLQGVWPDAIVEENALSVHVVALRKALGKEAGRLRTIHGVGYLLDLSATGSPASPSAASSRRWQPRRVAIFTLPALVLAVALVGLWTRRPISTDDLVLIEPLRADGGEGARLLAVALQGDIGDVFHQSHIQTVDPSTVGGDRKVTGASRILRGTATESSGRLKAYLSIEDATSGVTLWSAQFGGNSASADDIAGQASAAAARTLSTLGELHQQKGLTLDPATIALFVRGGELLRSAQFLEEAAARETLEQLVGRAPKSAAGHALLAVALVGEARRAAPDLEAGLLARSRKEAAKAIEIDPFAAGGAYDALYLASRTDQPRQFERAEQILRTGLERAPEFAYLSMRQCRFLTEVGRARDAVGYCQRALALQPFAEPVGHSFASALAATGDEAAAAQAIDRSARLYPQHRMTRRVRFELAAFGDRVSLARQLLGSAAKPAEMRPEAEKLMARFLAWRDDRGGGSDARLAEDFFAAGRNGNIRLDWAVTALSSLGRTDQALALLTSPRMDETLTTSGSGFLFRPALASLRKDPGFWPVAAQLGLAQYWSASGKWPDFCYGELDLAACKSAANRALANARPAAKSR
jgi:DNA-binding winged helix-turn-helix (wHTH) protein/tetratricopeptide (TPR) repeat protein